MLEEMDGDLQTLQTTTNLWTRPVLLWKCYQQGLAAIHELHRLGWVHRDIKPENFMYKLSGTNNKNDVRLKLGDFGFIANVSQPRIGTTCTPAYASPWLIMFECYAMEEMKRYKSSQQCNNVPPPPGFETEKNNKPSKSFYPYCKEDDLYSYALTWFNLIVCGTTPMSDPLKTAIDENQLTHIIRNFQKDSTSNNYWCAVQMYQFYSNSYVGWCKQLRSISQMLHVQDVRLFILQQIQHILQNYQLDSYMSLPLGQKSDVDYIFRHLRHLYKPTTAVNLVEQCYVLSFKLMDANS